MDYPSKSSYLFLGGQRTSVRFDRDRVIGQLGNLPQNETTLFQKRRILRLLDTLSLAEFRILHNLAN